MRRSHEVRVWNTFLPAVMLGPVVSVLIAFTLSLAANRLFLPVIGDLGDEPLSLFFLVLPVAATVAIGLREGRSRTALWLGGILTVILSQVFSYLCWIGWIVVACGIQENRCFE